MHTTTRFDTADGAGGQEQPEAGRRTAVLGALLLGAALTIGLGQAPVVEAIRGALDRGVLGAAGGSPVMLFCFLAVVVIYVAFTAAAALAGFAFCLALGIVALAKGRVKFLATRASRAMPGTRWTFAEALMAMALAGVGVRAVSPVFAGPAGDQKHVDTSSVGAGLGERR